MKTTLHLPAKLMSAIILLFFCFPACHASAWKFSDYGRNNHTTFRKFPPALAKISPFSPDHALLSAAIHYATNRERLRRGLPALRPSRELNRCARYHSRQMGVRNFFSHDNPHVPSMRTPWQRMAVHGVPGGSRAENIAGFWGGSMTYREAGDKIVAMWMKSPGHRANLLGQSSRYLGCGTHVSPSAGLSVLATQVFSSDAPSL